MLRTDLLVGRYETVEVLHRFGCGELVRAEAEGAAPALLLLPASEAAGRTERRRMETLAGVGTPRCVRWLGVLGSAGALVLDVPADARPLYALDDLPPVTLRAGLVRLLRALSRAHSRGLVHGGISRATILADPCGEFWLTDWSAATSPAVDAVSAVARDLEALGRAFVAALRRQPWPEGPASSASAPATDGADGAPRFAGLSRDFGRVLARVVSGDPRTSYRSATEVLADLGYPDTPDPWVFVPFVGEGEEVARVEECLAAAREPPDGDLPAAPTVVEIVGGHGSGKSRLLGEIAARLRASGAVVFHAHARAGVAWGGIGEIARQLAQFVPDGPLHDEHADVLLLLSGETAKGPADAAAAATAALCALSRAAFADSPGALLLDDADELRPAERETWRAIGRYLGAVNEDGAGIQVVVVSTAATNSTPEPGTRRETLALGEWPTGRLREFLERVLANPAAARDVAGPLRAAAGGHPGEVVEYLRDLERRGGLVTEGARWRFESPLHELGAWTPGIAEYVRRASDSAGRDACALAETVSVATECRLTRSDTSALSELSGPRLWQAAERAVEAGLLRSDGSTWRVRTEAIRRKVYAGIAEARRRSLHRELLFRLLERDPHEPVAIAHHACACDDARASELTEHAIDHLTAVHDYDGAIRLLEHAAATLAEPHWGRARHLQLATLRRRAGRLGEAIEQLNAILADPTTPTDTTAQAHLCLVEAHYFARQWEDAIQVPLPPPPADPDLLARIRLLRAISHVYLHRPNCASREERLARAELGGSAPSIDVQSLLLEHAYLVNFSRSEFARAATCLLECMRLTARTGRRDSHVRALIRYANVQRFLRDGDLALAVLARANTLLGEPPTTRRDLKHVYSNTKGYVLDRKGDAPGAIREWELGYHAGLQTGSAALGRAIRMRLAYARLVSGTDSSRDRWFAITFFRDARGMTRRDLLDTGIAASEVAVWYALQAPLEWMCERLSTEDHRSLRIRQVLARGVHGRLMLGATLDMPWLAAQIEEPQALADLLAGLSSRSGLAQGTLRRGPLRPDDEFALLLPAYMLRQGRFGMSGWPEHWTPGQMLVWAVECPDQYAGAALALALALWAPVDWNQEQWDSILAAVRARGRTLPMPLLWQRLVLESSDAWRRGSRERAMRLLAEAGAQLRALRGSADDKWTDSAAALGEQFVSDVALRRSARPPVRPRPDRNDDVTIVDRGPVTDRTWAELRMLVNSSRRAVLYSPFTHELARFVDGLSRGLSPTPPEPAFLSSEHGACLYLPSLMPQPELSQCLPRLSRAVSDGERVMVALCVDPETFRRAGALPRAILGLVDGTRVVLRSACEDPARRADLFLETLTRLRPGASLSPSAGQEIARHAWPGGLAEMEAVASSVADVSTGLVTSSTLTAVGWESRLLSSQACAESALTSLVLRALAERGSASTAELAETADYPLRTVQRELARLARLGRVLRLGRARATRYTLSIALN